MAAVHQVQIDDLTYTVVDDRTIVYQALFTGVVRDETSGEPLRTPFSVYVQRKGVHIKTFDEGRFCGTGYVERVFPDLSMAGKTMVVIAAPGYLEQSLTIPPPDGNFPASAPDVQLRRVPIWLQGRVVNSLDRTPIAQAQVLAVQPTGATEHAITLLRTPLHFRHNRDVSVHARPLSPAGLGKQLMAAVRAGRDTITLNNRSDLAQNDILRLGSDIDAEYVTIASLAPTPMDPNLTGDVTLYGALYRSFPVNTVVQKVMRGMIELTSTLGREADAGDGVLIVKDELPPGPIEIADSDPERVEYCTLGALTDSAGFYRFDGVGRVRTVVLEASATGFEALSPPRAWIIDYNQPVSVVDLRLPPL